MKAIQLTEFSGADAMEYVDVPDPEPGEGQVVVEVSRCGVNFADTHVTRNDYLAKQELPLIPGGEVSGRTPDGHRVAAMLMNGGYAQKVAVPEAMLVPVPDDGLRRSGRGAPAPGPDRSRAGPPLRSARARRDRCRRGGGRRHREPCGAAREAPRAPA